MASRDDKEGMKAYKAAWAREKRARLLAENGPHVRPTKTEKHCKKCDKTYPLTLEYFEARKEGCGFGKCRVCQRAAVTARRKTAEGRLAHSKNALKRYHERKHTDLIFKTKLSLRNRLNRALGRKLAKGTVSSVKDLGCDMNVFVAYMESRFHIHPETGEPMTWANHTINGWHIDHIKPLASAQTTEELRALCHYTNLQPLWSEQNLRKGAA